MEEKRPVTDKEQKKSSGGAAFIGYAVVVFTVLAIGLYIILVRSSA